MFAKLLLPLFWMFTPILLVAQSPASADSLSKVYQHKRDSLQAEKGQILLVMRELVDTLIRQQNELDSLMTETQGLLNLMEKVRWNEQILLENREKLRLKDSLWRSTITTTEIQSGYYFRRDTTSQFGKIEWLYVSKNNQVRDFFTADYEYCLSPMNFTADPKENWKLMKRKNKRFEQLYADCFGGPYITSHLLNFGRLVLYNNFGLDVNRDELFFTEKGLLRKKIGDNDTIYVKVYEFIGE